MTCLTWNGWNDIIGNEEIRLIAKRCMESVYICQIEAIKRCLH